MAISIPQRASGLWSYAQSQIDRIISPESRQKYYLSISTFAQEQPILFVRYESFILIHLLLSFLPLLLFATFILTTLLLSLSTALLFTLFWTGVALLFLLPTLFITVTIGVLIWCWGVGGFFVVRWLGGLVLGGRGEGKELVSVNGNGTKKEEKKVGFEGKGN